MNKFAVNKSAMNMMNLMIIRSMIIMIGLIPVSGMMYMIMLMTIKCLKIGKVTFFLGEKSSENQKSYVLGSDPFDEVYKGVQLSLVGYFAPFRR